MSTENREKDPSSSPKANKKPPLSCAECRRLKLKCNRVWPCLSCQKRGLAEICPAGSLATRPRHKPPPPTPQHVVELIHGLQGRIKQLETALSTVQATVSEEPHPLLQSDTQPYLQKKLMRKEALGKARHEGLEEFVVGSSYIKDESTHDCSDESGEDIIAALGTLKIAPDGRSTFFGPTAVSEGLSIQDPAPSTGSEQMTTLPVDIVALSQAFPFATASTAVTALQEHVKLHLPPVERAETLCQSFFTHASFVMYVISEDEWFETLFCRLYGRRRAGRHSSDSHHQEGAVGHQWHLVPADELSVFFCVLALGVLTDLSVDPFNPEAEAYYHLARALFTTENVLTEPTITSIQTLCLSSYFEGLRSKHNSSRDCWIMLVLASKTAQIMGLHRDHSMFGLDDREVQRRRLVFWETYSMDMVQSLALGRPPSTPASYTDTQMPIDTHGSISPSGEPEESFYRWKYRFCAEVLTVISDHVLRVKTPNYEQALETDRRMRKFTTTFRQGHPNSRTWSYPSTAAQIQMMLGTRETCAQLLQINADLIVNWDHTSQPERSKYGRSVLAAYESARIIVQGMEQFVTAHAKFAARLWFLWNHLLSASFVLGSIAARAPSCSLAPSSLAELDTIERTLKQAAIYGGRAEYMLPVINKLRIKGHNAHMSLQGGASCRPSHNGMPTDPEENDELAVIGGKARIVISRQSSMSPPEPPPLVYDTTTDSSPTLSTSLHLPQPPEPVPAILECYPQSQSGNMYSAYQPDASSSQRQDAYWSNDLMQRPSSEVLHDVYPFGYLHTEQEKLMLYPSSSSLHQQQDHGQHDYFAQGVSHFPGHNADRGTWQSLVRDLDLGV